MNTWDKERYKEIWIHLEDDEQSMMALINGEFGWLMYVLDSDTDYDSLHSENPDYTGPEDETMEFILNNGQLDRYPLSYVLPVDKIHKAMEYFAAHQKPPGFILWCNDNHDGMTMNQMLERSTYMLEQKNLEQVKELIDCIADSYDLPTDEQVSEMRRLTGIDWEAEDLQMICCEYWSHNSLEETAYQMFHETLPPIKETELAFWRYKQGAALEDRAVYDKFRLGGTMKALEALPVERILEEIRACFPDWTEDEEREEGWSYRFDSTEQAEYWKDIHFWIFLYSTKTEIRQMVKFSCQNMSEEQINMIIQCMDRLDCPLHIRDERDMEDEE